MFVTSKVTCLTFCFKSQSGGKDWLPENCNSKIIASERDNPFEHPVVENKIVTFSGNRPSGVDHCTHTAPHSEAEAFRNKKEPFSGVKGHLKSELSISWQP